MSDVSDLSLRPALNHPDGYATAFYLAQRSLRAAPGLSMLTEQAIDAITHLAIRPLFDEAASETPASPAKRPTVAPGVKPQQSPVTTETMFKIPRRGTIAKGTELTVEGIRGRVRFVQACFHQDSGKQWLDVIHVRTGQSRAIDPARIKTVHR